MIFPNFTLELCVKKPGNAYKENVRKEFIGNHQQQVLIFILLKKKKNKKLFIAKRGIREEKKNE